MRLLTFTYALSFLVACGEAQGSGTTEGRGGHESEGGSGGAQGLGGSSGIATGGVTAGGSELGGSSGSAGSSSGLGGAGGAGPSGGVSAGGALSVSSGGMGMLSGACEGAFAAPSPQILAGKSPASNLSVTGDELELFFNLDNVISSHKRATTSILFPDATPVTELGGVCGELVVGGMDVTLDGLRLYIACSDDSGFVGPLRLATRADRQSPFTLAPKDFGTVGNSISISQDELSLFAVTAPGTNGYTQVFQRASLDAPFGPGELVMGLGGAFQFPEISADGLNLFGVAGTPPRLVVASRGAASGPFSAPTSAGLPAPMGSASQFGPTTSQVCRLWYLNFSPGATSTINVLPR
jgi:hypothetical protein